MLVNRLISSAFDFMETRIFLNCKWISIHSSDGAIWRHSLWLVGASWCPSWIYKFVRRGLINTSSFEFVPGLLRVELVNCACLSWSHCVARATYIWIGSLKRMRMLKTLRLWEADLTFDTRGWWMFAHQNPWTILCFPLTWRFGNYAIQLDGCSTAEGDLPRSEQEMC